MNLDDNDEDTWRTFWISTKNCGHGQTRASQLWSLEGKRRGKGRQIMFHPSSPWLRTACVQPEQGWYCLKETLRKLLQGLPYQQMVTFYHVHKRSNILEMRYSLPGIAVFAKAILRNNFRTEWQQHLDIGTEEDSIHQLDRAAQVTIFRLRIGHCQLLSHLHRLKISHSDECPCNTVPQPPNHILQSCPTFDALRRQKWPSPVDARRKLWGPVETLQQTVDITLLTRLKI